MYNGIFSALVTPFLSDSLKIDYDSLKNLINYQVENSISGLVVCGSTGEAATLSKDEYLEVLQFVKDTVKSKKVNNSFKLIAGVGSNNTAFGVEIAKEVNKIRYDAYLVVAPPYNKPTQEGIYQHIKNIKIASDADIIAYNVPGRTVSNILPQTVTKLAQDKIIVGLKEASGNFSQLNDVLSLCRDEIDVLLGEDAFIFPSLSIGAKGGISVISNVSPKEMMDMYKLSLDCSDLNKAKELHFKLLPFIHLLFSESNPIPVKYALYKKGIINSYEVRLPLTKATKETQEKIDNFLNNIDNI